MELRLRLRYFFILDNYNIKSPNNVVWVQLELRASLANLFILHTQLVHLFLRTHVVIDVLSVNLVIYVLPYSHYVSIWLLQLVAIKYFIKVWGVLCILKWLWVSLLRRLRNLSVLVGVWSLVVDIWMRIQHLLRLQSVEHLGSLGGRVHLLVNGACSLFNGGVSWLLNV